MMKKNYNFLTKAALVLLTLLFVPLGMMGQTSGSATLTWSEQGLDNAASVDGVAYDLGNYFTVTCNKNSASTAPTYYSSGTAVRCYATKNTNNGNTIVVAKKSSVTENVFITKVEYNGTHNKKGTTSFAYSGNPSETTTTSASYDEGDQVTTASATLCETGGSTNGQFYCTSVTVEYVVVSADVPSISLSPASVDVPYTGGNGTLTLTTANLAADPQLDVMFYDMDGAVSDDIIRAEIAGMLTPFYATGIFQKVRNLIETLRMVCFSEPITIAPDEIHLMNGVLKTDGTWTEEKQFCINRLRVCYEPDSPHRPERFLSFLKTRI